MTGAARQILIHIPLHEPTSRCARMWARPYLRTIGELALTPGVHSLAVPDL
jgi:hypothetical protein